MRRIKVSGITRKELHRQGIYSREDIFLIVYFIFILGLYLSVNSATPFASLWQKLKYPYIVFCFMDAASHRKSRAEIKTTICLGGLLFYIVFFGCIVRYPTASVEIRDNTILMMYYWLMLAGTVLELNYYKCYRRFVEYNYHSLVIFIAFVGITHLSQIVWNPLYVVRMLVQQVRVGSDFGFLTSNYMGNYGFVALAFSVVVFFMLLDEGKLSWLWISYFILGDMGIFLVMQSASSRSPTLSLILFVMGVFYFELIGNKRIFRPDQRKKIRLIMMIAVTTAVIVFTVLGGWQYLWDNSNRSLNVTANLPYVGIIGTKWTGMGFVENAAFQSTSWLGKPSAFGVYTSSLDMYYLYVYCTTGILGSIIIGSILLFILYNSIKGSREKMGGIILSFTLVILFYAFWETIIFSCRFWGMLPVVAFLISWLGYHGKKRYLIL